MCWQPPLFTAHSSLSAERGGSQSYKQTVGAANRDEVVTGEEKGSKSALLDRSVGAELDAEAITDGSNHLRDLCSTKDAVLLVLCLRRFAANLHTVILTVLLLITSTDGAAKSNVRQEHQE
jgi:hypothetical protein